MYQGHRPVTGEMHATNPTGEEGESADSTTAFELVVRCRRLNWIGPLAFKTRYAPRRGADPDFGMLWGPGATSASVIIAPPSTPPKGWPTGTRQSLGLSSANTRWTFSGPRARRQGPAEPTKSAQVGCPFYEN